MTDFLTLIEKMTLREKLCQMIMGQIEGVAVTSNFLNFMTEYPLGAYRLAGWNIESADQVKSFLRDIRIAFQDNGNIEPVIASDEEGGTLSVFRGIIPDFPGTMALGATRSPDMARLQAQIIGKYLCDMGLTMDFTPVCDVNLVPENTVIGVRAYGEDPILCGQLALETALGVNEGGVLNCAKHFPGHGGTYQDTHFCFATDPISREDFDQIELKSFLPVIKADVDSIFVDHVVYPCIDDKLPASLSEAMITGVLRNQAGYKGVIMTDDLTMKAIVDGFGIPDAALMHILAGGDMAMVCGDQKAVIDTYKLLLRSVENGLLTESRVDASVIRILRMKERMERYRQNAMAEFPYPPKQLSRDIASAALTLIRDPRGLLPLRSGARTLIILPELINLTLSDTSGGGQIHLDSFMRNYTNNIEVVTTTMDESSHISELAARARGYNYVIMCIYGALKYRNQIELVHALHQNAPVIAVLIREPYDAQVIPNDVTTICAYSAIDSSMEATANALFGKAPMPGVLPVTVS